MTAKWNGTQTVHRILNEKIFKLKKKNIFQTIGQKS